MQDNEKDLMHTETELEAADMADESEETDAVSSFAFSDGDVEEVSEKPKKAGMVKKQIIMISVFAAVALILALVYFIVLRPIFEERTKEEENEPLPLLEGEVRDSGGVAVLMFPHVEKAKTNKITVKNSFGGYTLVRETVGSETNFIISEHPAAPIASETISKIVVSAGYSVIMSRPVDNCPTEELSKYGLSEDDDPTKVTVEDTSGNVYTYFVGDMIPSGGGYYARYSTRNTVYIINADSAGTINQSAQSLLSPMLGYPLSSDAATMIDFFAITKNGEDFISFEYDATESDETSKSIYKMIFPGDYVINSDTVAATVTATLAALEGGLVIEAGDGTAEGLLYKNEKLMSQYGFHDLEKPAYEIFYSYGEYSSYIIFTEAGVEGYYYAYSYIWDTIVLVPAANVPYLSWNLLEYMMSNIFYEEIGKVDYIHVSGLIESAGKEHDINEKIYYWKDKDGDLNSRAESTGWTYDGNYSEQNHAQSFFISVACLYIEGYASEMGFDKANAEEYARMEVGYTDGTVDEYVFYKSGGYCYYEINGVGEFYVLTRQVNKVLIDAVRAANNCKVDWEAEYAEYPSENELLKKN